MKISIEAAKILDFGENGGFRTRNFPITHLGMESERKRKCTAKSFLELLLGGDSQRVAWDFKDPSLARFTPADSSLEEAWASLASLNEGGLNVHFAPILRNRLADTGRLSIVPPSFFAVDIEVAPSEFGDLPEEFLEILGICQRLEIPFTYCVSGSEKLTLYWAIERQIPLYLWSAIQSHLVAIFGAPPVSLLPSESRLLPGMSEWYEGTATLPHVLQSMTRPYGLEEFAEAFGLHIVPRSDLEVSYERGFPCRAM